MTNLKNHLLGRGVFSSSHYRKEDFLVEYRGDIITKEECERRRRLYHNALEVFLFQLLFNGRLLWVDAAREDGSLGRLINDNHINTNSKMKIINVDRKPYLCLFATKDISPGQEITYNYDVSEWPWRNKVTSDTEIQTSTSLSCAGQKTGTQKCCSSKRVTSDTEIQTSTSLSCAGDNTGTQKVTSDTEIQTSTSLSCAGENGGTQKVTSDTEIQTSTSLSCAGDNTGTQKICKLYVISVAVSSLDKCASCSGPYNAFKWVRVKCKIILKSSENYARRKTKTMVS
ncbi:uncharacterized protein isoform X1 [Danio rerio]|uniref:Uncharacterized protein isoform X1 n=1 Tax=Danio rerio TaxID=7955 RepID=A0AB32T7T7_DANRE